MSNVDDSQVRNLFAKLDDENRSRMMFKALKKGAEHLQNQTQTLLRTRLANSASMVKGVKLKSDKSYNEISVHIMGDYRLRWFEKGTKPRKTKGHKVTGYNRSRRIRSGKGGNRGAIRPLYYFRDARQSDIDSVMIQTLDELMK